MPEDFSSLSTEELLKQYQAARSPDPPKPATGPDLSSMSTEDLLRQYRAEKYAKANPEDVGAGMALSGVPVLGAFVPQAEAAIRSAAQPFTGVGAPGATYGERYAENLARQKAQYRQAEEEQPWTSAALQVGGGLAATAPIAATATGARLLGMGGRALTQPLYGAASGAGISAADALARGQDPGTAAMFGGGLGAAAPVIGGALGRAAEGIANTARGVFRPEAEAARRVASYIERDVRAAPGTSVPGLTQAEYAATPEARLVDLGGETTRAAQRSAANTSPEGRELIQNTINERFRGQVDRVGDYVRQRYGFPNAFAQQQALEQTARGVNNAAYARAMQEGAGGLWSPELERLAGSRAVSGAMQRAAEASGDEAVLGGAGAFNPRISFTPDGRMQFARGPSGMPTYPDLRYWDLVRRELGDAGTAATRAGRNAEGRRLSGLAAQMNAALDQLVPSYAQARAGAAAFFGAGDALEAGQKFATQAFAADATRQAVANMTPQERALFRDGFVSRLLEKMGGVGNQRNIVNVFDNPNMQEKLQLALGRQGARELEAHLRIEGMLDRARTALGNSTTARQWAELGLAGGAGTLLGGGLDLNPESLAWGALAAGLAGGRQRVNSRLAQEVARMLMSRDVNVLNRGINIITQHEGLMQNLRALGGGAAIAGTQQTQ